jgi:pimeloyl-ACP methyl ester carboxylesterase
VTPPPGISWLVNGSGAPVTVFLPGLGGALAHLRPLGGGVPGTRVFCEVAGDPAPDDPAPDDRAPDDYAPDDYASLAQAAGSAVRACGADRALGVSLGAGALLRLMSTEPDVLARAVLYQPSALDVAPADRLAELETFLALAAAGEIAALAALLADELPGDLRATRPALDAARARAQRLARPEGLRLLKNLATGEPPVPDPRRLAAVRTEVLVVTGRDDPVHPAAVAEQIAGVLPRATLKVFDTPAPLVHARSELRALLSAFLGG